jgi:hypothetical protein
MTDLTPGYDYHQPPPVRQPAFTFQCPWGCAVHVEGGKEQPHTCQGTSAIVDALRIVAIEGTVLEHSERLARMLDPTLRELKHESWVTGVHDGRSGQKFYGIDPEAS